MMETPVNGARSPFWKMLQARAEHVKARLQKLETDAAAEFSALVGYSGHAANGDDNKVQSLSEVVYALVILMADKFVEDAEAEKNRDVNAGVAMKTHVASCPVAPRVDVLERALTEVEEKRVRKDPIEIASEAVEKLADGRGKAALRFALASVSVLYPIRWVMIVAVFSPHTAPILRVVLEALNVGK